MAQMPSLSKAPDSMIPDTLDLHPTNPMRRPISKSPRVSDPANARLKHAGRSLSIRCDRFLSFITRALPPKCVVSEDLNQCDVMGYLK